MTKESLKEKGLTEEQATAVMGMLDDTYVPKSRFNEVVAERNQLKEKVKERDGQMESLKNAAGTVEGLQKQIADLQAANTEKDKAHAAELKRLKREALDERLLGEGKAINPTAVKPFLAAIDAGVDDEGYIALRKQHIEALSKAESTKFLFQSSASAPAAGFKPGESGSVTPPIPGGNPFAKDSYNEAEQKRMYKENPDAARVLAKAAGWKIF